MKLNCPNINCKLSSPLSPKTSNIVRKGFFFRSSDSRWLRRYFCNACLKTFSRAGLSATRYQKVRRFTPLLDQLINSGVSQRRSARILKVDRKTVVRRLRFLAAQARAEQEEDRQALQSIPLQAIEFDDLETSEHTKCKPLSVSLAVEPKSRKILGFQVSQMPAKGRLSKISVRKYGFRKDERKKGWNKLLSNLKPILAPNVTITTDENPHYTARIKAHFPRCTHVQIPGGRGASTGQGELRDKRFDPMFALNHTCAMLRANMNRLFRKTWCTTKTRQGLIDHLSLYVRYHNQVLTQLCPLKGAS